jgi:hypothetical protein
VPKDFLSLIRRPADLLKALRRITVGGVIATAGVSTGPSVVAAGPQGSEPVQGLTPTIVDRSRKAPKLVLHLPGTTAYVGTEHRSHRSHSSHRSHYSSSGGGGSSAPAPPAPRPSAPATSAASVLDVEAKNSVSGEVVAIDTSARTITIRDSIPRRTTFGYRDDTKFEAGLGVTVRFDDFAEAKDGRLPVSIGDKVQIAWRTSPDGKTQIVSRIKKTP